ncbi:hypothetical protein [Streptomyces sp. NPDC127066]|uniref:hypothetical protein n=1 Tax=Streptomyces sp. NPDC127066 TaxID=3347125 RepID=UPI00365066B6
MSAPKEIRAENVAYAAGLRDALDTYLKNGGTQTATASAVHISNAALTRYLKGERTAPPDFLTDLQDFLSAQGHPLSASQIARLASLCEKAHRASDSPAVQLRHVENELRQLEDELERLRQAERVTAQELNRLAERSRFLEDRLSEALEHAEAMQGERDELAETAGRQEGQLESAQKLIRATSDENHALRAELQRRQEETRRLSREVHILGAQNQILLEESTPAETGDAVPSVSTQVSHRQGPPAKDRQQPPNSRPVPGQRRIQPSGSPRPEPALPSVPASQVAKATSELSQRLRQCRTSGQLAAVLRFLWQRKRYAYLQDKNLAHDSGQFNVIERNLIHALRTLTALPAEAAVGDMGANVLKRRGATPAEIEDFREAFSRISALRHRYEGMRGLGLRIKDRHCHPETFSLSVFQAGLGYLLFWLGTTCPPALFFADAFAKAPGRATFSLFAGVMALICGWILVSRSFSQWAGTARLLKALHWSLVGALLVLPWLPVTKDWPLWLPSVTHALSG